jgi:outer membrane protein, heavy metal efflux system
MIAFLFLLIASAGFCLDEAEVRKSVLENFPLIEAAVLKAKSADGDVLAAEGEFDHKLGFKSRNRIEEKYDNSYFESTLERVTPWRGVSLMAGHRQGLGTFPAYDGKYATSAAGEIFAGLSFPILRNSSTDSARTGLAIAQIEKQQAEEELRLKKNLYVHKALSLFLKWRLEQQKLMIRKEILALAESRTFMLERRLKAGDLEAIKLTDNVRSIRKRQEELLKAEIEVSRYRTELSLYLPDKPLSTEPAPFSKVSPELQVSPALSLENVPQVRIAELEIKKLRLSEDLFDQGRLPGLSVDLLGAKELSNNEPYDPERLSIGLKFDYPLENRKARGKTVAFSYKAQAAQKQNQYIRNELTRFHGFSMESALMSVKRWKTVSEEFDNTARMALAEKSKWAQGSSDLFLVNLREQDVADADIRRWTALYEIKQFELDAQLYSAGFGI